MRAFRRFSLVFLIFVIVFSSGCTGQRATASTPLAATSSPSISPGKETVMKMPEPNIQGNVSIEETLFERRSVRGYKNEPLTLAEVSQLLWAAQGVTDAAGLRTAPSAGATYPLEVYLFASNVTGLPAGIYKYVPDGHRVELIIEGDRRGELSRNVVGQTFVGDAPAAFVITAVYARTTQRYGDRGVRYADMEAGHAGENLLLQGVALGIGAVTVGAFDDNGVSRLLNLAGDEKPLYIIPAGRK